MGFIEPNRVAGVLAKSAVMNVNRPAPAAAPAAHQAPGPAPVAEREPEQRQRHEGTAPSERGRGKMMRTRVLITRADAEYVRAEKTRRAIEGLPGRSRTIGAIVSEGLAALLDELDRGADPRALLAPGTQTPEESVTVAIPREVNERLLLTLDGLRSARRAPAQTLTVSSAVRAALRMLRA